MCVCVCVGGGGYNRIVSASPPELILMKLYTVAVYDLRMFMKERSSGMNYFK